MTHLRLGSRLRRSPQSTARACTLPYTRTVPRQPRYAFPDGPRPWCLTGPGCATDGVPPGGTISASRDRRALSAGGEERSALERETGQPLAAPVSAELGYQH